MLSVKSERHFSHSPPAQEMQEIQMYWRRKCIFKLSVSFLQVVLSGLHRSQSHASRIVFTSFSVTCMRTAKVVKWLQLQTVCSLVLFFTVQPRLDQDPLNSVLLQGVVLSIQKLNINYFLVNILQIHRSVTFTKCHTIHNVRLYYVLFGMCSVLFSVFCSVLFCSFSVLFCSFLFCSVMLCDVM